MPDFGAARLSLQPRHAREKGQCTSLAEVITEAYAWCMEHREAIEELRRLGL
jgi:hypothetical protein